MNKITVRMTKEYLYDFLLFHAYSKFSGFLINILGLAVAFMGIIMYTTNHTGVTGLVFYLIAAVIFLGGTPLQCTYAASTVLMNMLGLVCDPVGGLVEYPCQNRNAAGVSNALIAAEMSLAGIPQFIPLDEMIDAMGRDMEQYDAKRRRRYVFIMEKIMQ